MASIIIIIRNDMNVIMKYTKPLFVTFLDILYCFRINDCCYRGFIFQSSCPICLTIPIGSFVTSIRLARHADVTRLMR